MHEPGTEDANTAAATGAVRVVRAGDVAALRRSAPDGAIVALVRSTEPGEALRAQLAGADVVLPCADPDAPDRADLDAARTAARLLADRAWAIREQTRAAAHEFAGNASAVALIAHLFGPDEPAQRVAQLRQIAGRGAELAWRAGRIGRSRGTAVQPIDPAAAVRAIGRAGVRFDVEPGPAGWVLVDPVRLADALDRLIDNARRAGAREITVRVSREHPGWVSVAVVDDGRGLPDGWTAAAPAPYRSGWPVPGDGLGLAEVAEFAADHGGTLRLEPRADASGVRAVLWFPAVDGSVLACDSARRPAAADPDWALAGILEGIAGRAPLEDSLEALVATMERHLPGSSCSILLHDPDAGTLRHGAGARLPEPYRAAIDGLLIGPRAGSCGTAAYTRREVVVTDIAADERWADYRHLALPFGLRSCWSRPILTVDRQAVLGTFAVYHGEPWTPGPAATELVGRLTHVAAIAIGTAALHGELVASEGRFRSTFEAAGLGIALVDPSGRVQDANAALVALAGRSVVGESFSGLLVDDDAITTDAALAALLTRPGDGQRLAPVEVRVRRHDRADPVDDEAQPTWAAMSGSLIRGPGGEPRHFCIELFDLTERRRVAQARRERAVAQAADRAKSELLTLVSHEVRTPLHAVIGFAQVVQTMPLTPERQAAAIDHILAASRHLLQLFNDLLDRTGAETRQLPMVLESVATPEVVAEAIRIVAGLAESRSITLRSSVAANVVLGWVDRNRLRQVLLNLLGNAIKFTPVGGAVQVTTDAAGIAVTDTGPGIPADQLPRLFTPFHRGGRSDAEGSGLGLALSQQLMRAMDGDLTLVASSPAGTTFRVVLPPAAPVISRRRGAPASVR